MRYYREIDIPNLDIIIDKCLAFVKDATNGYISIGSPWNSLNCEALLNACPELRHAFSQYDLMPINAAAFIMHSQAGCVAHIDSDQFHSVQARINFPLLNCKNTFTEFYSNAQVRFVPPGKFAGYYQITNINELVLEDRVEISKATVLRVREPHCVKMPADNPKPRVSLTVGYQKDPVFLLEE